MSDPQLHLFAPRLRVTRPARAHRRGAGLVRRVRRCLALFPELYGQTITVGVTRIADGVAIWEDMTIRFDIRRRLPTHYTIGHELTHLLQALGLVPQGEVQCDIWTLARDPLLRDEHPCYLEVPRPVVDTWPRHARAVGELCAEAIALRPRHRTYIRWLGQRLAGLPGDGTGDVSRSSVAVSSQSVGAVSGPAASDRSVSAHSAHIPKT